MPIPPETVALVRQRYSDHVPVEAIKRETGLSTGSLYWCIDGCPHKDEPQMSQLPRRRDVQGKLRRAIVANRSSLVARLWRTAERQVRDIEQRLRRADIASGEREREARVMAILVKTVRELTAIDDKNPELGAQDDERSLEDFRAELAAKIDAIIARRGTEAGDGADPASEA